MKPFLYALLIAVLMFTSLGLTVHYFPEGSLDLKNVLMIMPGSFVVTGVILLFTKYQQAGKILLMATGIVMFFTLITFLIAMRNIPC
ncbi:hypothetical protein [Chitinophaga arvensicola]|uniref:Uncharacterized protein n=1 Tax=Chitinophaga arvensicola TaxID=29529 RepID=A0A1I0NDW0_9BACT|nr:hypothetical protein [Chitinophaga arvensicola]SEV99280.1 hypothetical protein SAMN04488122_0108 [Chitinophaga arvensicola]